MAQIRKGNSNMLVDEVLHNIEEGLAFEVSVVGTPEEHHSVAQELINRMKDKPDYQRIACVDLSKCDSFADMLYQILRLIKEDAKLAADDVEIDWEEVFEGQSEGELVYIFQGILADFSSTFIQFLLVIEHFELAKTWNATQCGLMRGFFADNNSPLCGIFMADRTIEEITKLPEGSSPLFNIFSIWNLEVE